MSLLDSDSFQRRVVITGMGTIAPNGKTLETFWDSLRNGRSGAAVASRYDVSNLPVKFAAEIKDFEISDYINLPKVGRLELTVQYGLAAASMAVKDSKLDVHRMNPDRIGVVEGTTTSGAANVISVYASIINKEKIHPYNAIGGYCGEGSSAIGMFLGINGHALTYCSGCASGNDAIGHAWRTIRDDEVDVMVVGGADAIFETQHIGFCRLRAMSELPGLPGRAMRPFDRTRDGFVLGEGAAFFVLEELSHALNRGAQIYCEIIGHGRSCEAYHSTDPHPDGVGYINAMKRALRSARITADEVNYINAHGSATPLNDPLESKSIKQVFGDHAHRIGVSATKPVTGHTMGASGAIETAVCALAIKHQEMPPTINLENADEGCDLDYLSDGPRPYPIRIAVNLNAGFGGRYACLILRQFHGNEGL